MGVIKRQSIKGTIYSYVGVLLGFINVVLLFPRILDTEQIGLVNLMVAISTIFAQFGSLGFNSVTTRLFSYFRDKSKGHNGFLFLAFATSLVGAIIVITIFYFLTPVIIQQNASKSGLLASYINLNYLLIFFLLFFTILDNYCKVLFNSTLGTFYKEVVFRLLTLLNLLMLYFSIYDFDAFVLIYILSLCFPTLALMAQLMIEGELNLKPDFSFINKPMARQIASVAFFGILSGIGGIAISNVDKYLVSSFLNLSLTGVYSISFFFGTLILISSRSLIKISAPVLADSWKNTELKTIFAVYHKSCLNQFIVGLFICVGLWANIDNVFRILPEEYASGKYVILFVALANLIEMLAGTSGMIIQTSKYYPFLTYFRAGSIVVLVVSNIILVPLFGITGAALAVLATRVFMTLIKFWFILSKFEMQPYDLKILYGLGIGILSLLPAIFIPALDSLYLDIIVRSIAVAIIYLVGLILIKPSEEIDTELIKFWNTTRSWFRS